MFSIQYYTIGFQRYTLGFQRYTFLSVFIKLKNFVKIKIVKIGVKFMVKCINIVLSFPQTYYIILT